MASTPHTGDKCSYFTLLYKDLSPHLNFTRSHLPSLMMWCIHVNSISTTLSRWERIHARERNLCQQLHESAWCKCCVSWHRMACACVSDEWIPLSSMCHVSCAVFSRRCNILIESCLIPFCLFLSLSLGAPWLLTTFTGCQEANNRHISKLIKLYWQVRTDGLPGAPLRPGAQSKSSMNDYCLKECRPEVDQCVSITKRLCIKHQHLWPRRNTV